LAFARTAEAVSLLRQCFPFVYQAWFVDSYRVGLADKFAGVNGEYDDSAQYPYLHTPRPILQHQLQFFVRDLKGDNDPNNRLRVPYPVRVQVEDLNEAGSYYDVLYSKGISVDGRRFIWLES